MENIVMNEEPEVVVPDGSFVAEHFERPPFSSQETILVEGMDGVKSHFREERKQHRLEPVMEDDDDDKPVSCSDHDSSIHRLWSRVRLEHTLEDDAPGFCIVKTALVIILALLIDRGTRNPDSITTCFVAVLGITPFMSTGKRIALSTLVCGLLGAVIGTLISAATYLPPADDPSNWMYLLSVPWSVCTTRYVLYLIAYDDPSSKATGLFSALFVILVKFPYPPIAAYVPLTDSRGLIWQTLLVRVIALSTAVFVSFVVNFAVSALAPTAIFKTQLYYTERLVWLLTAGASKLAPTEGMMQICFNRVTGLIATAPMVNKTASTFIFSNRTRHQARKIENRAFAMFRYLNLVSFLELCMENDYINDGDRKDVEKMLRKLRRDNYGGPIKPTMEEVATLEEEFANFPLLRCMFREVVESLDSSVVKFRDADKVSRFWGRV
jgi:hypothetical protein